MSAPLAHPIHLRPIDLVLVSIYLAGITIFGLRFRKSGERSPSSAFQGWLSPAISDFFRSPWAISWGVS
jgi:hypothetical protein